MSSIINHPIAQALAWALVHFVWQGAAIALAAFAIMRTGRLSASARYFTGVAAMAAMLMAPAITFARLSAVQSPGAAAGTAGTQHPPSPAASARQAPPSPAASARQAPPSPAASARQAPSSPAASARQAPVEGTPTSSIASATPGIVLTIWSAGVVILSLRLIGGWFVARRIARRATSPATPEIQALARKIAGRLALDRIVGVFESTAVSVPVMIGWIKPVVLLPTAALAGLSVLQVEALLAHELAHVRRHDYLVNLLQSAVETLLFYHPAVWWVSRRMRVDRELCCDDVALEVCDRIVYATALSDLAAMTTTPRMALAATDGPLLNRVRRILGQPVDRQDSGSGWLSACLMVLLVGSLAPSALTSTNEPQAAGVQSGVAGGVAQGVGGGVAGGVSAGVVGGMPDQEPVRSVRRVEVPSESAQAEEQRTADAAAAREKQMQEERSQIEVARADNEYRHARTQAETRLASLESDLNMLRQQYDLVKQRVAVGTANSTDLVEFQARIAKLQQEMNAQKVELEYLAKNFELSRREIALDREVVARRYEEQKLGPGERIVDAEASASAVEEAKLKKQRMAEELMVAERRQVVEAAGVVASPSEPVRAGDLLSITLHSEPDLPTMFVVQSDGTIRFPLVGAIRVVGLTARQVQEALGKQLADRKLAAGSGIEVTLRRPK